VGGVLTLSDVFDSTPAIRDVRDASVGKETQLLTEEQRNVSLNFSRVEGSKIVFDSPLPFDCTFKCFFTLIVALSDTGKRLFNYG
jgi:hypothetical protein